MQGILRGLVEGLVQATSGQQLSRAYLYGALLYYLQLTNEDTADQFTGNHYVYLMTVFMYTCITEYVHCMYNFFFIPVVTSIPYPSLVALDLKKY